MGRNSSNVRFQRIKRKLRRLQAMLEASSTSQSSNSDSESDTERRRKVQRTRQDSSPRPGPSRIRRISSSDSDGSELNTAVNQAGEESVDLNMHITRLLGNDPSIESALGVPIDENIASRWSTYILNGLEKESRDTLSEKWKIPENCRVLAAPKMNLETEGLLSSLEKKKDSVLANLQEKIGKGLGALGKVLTISLSNKVPEEIRSEFSPILADAGKIFCEVHHLISKHRKHQVYPLFNTSVQKVAEESKSEEWLFGLDFGEKCKTTQNIRKVASEISSKPAKKAEYKSSNFFSRRQTPHTKMKRLGYKEKRLGKSGKVPRKRYQELPQERKRHFK